MMKIVIASDSFKGSLSSTEVAAAASRGIKSLYPDCQVTCVNVADGGEGTVEAIVEALGGEIITVGSDAHTPDQVFFRIREAYDLLKSCGFRYVSEFRKRQCEFIPLT